MTEQKMILSAHAKINLTLDILSKRADGYHEVRMIMQEIGLADTVELQKTEVPGIILETDAPGIPTDRRNLCVKAAENLFERFSLPGGLRICLWKKIPAAAGLAGGSADAAAVLSGMRRLYGLPLDDEELRAEGKRIGADVPFCLTGGTALSEGIGEILTPVSARLPMSIVLVKPDADVSTRDVYEAFDRIPCEVHPDTDAMIAALHRGDLREIAGKLENVLEKVTSGMYPEIQTIRELLVQEGAVNARMSGSGPTVFGLFSERSAAEQAAEALGKKLPGVFVAVTEPVVEER